MDHFAKLYQRIRLCQDSEESDLYEAECGHIFHNRCILTWGLIKANVQSTTQSSDYDHLCHHYFNTTIVTSHSSDTYHLFYI